MVFPEEDNGPSKVVANSVAPILILPCTFFVLPLFCLNSKTEDKALSNLASKAEEESLTSSMKDTFNIPCGPPALPCVLKWLITGISIPSK